MLERVKEIVADTLGTEADRDYRTFRNSLSDYPGRHGLGGRLSSGGCRV